MDWAWICFLWFKIAFATLNGGHCYGTPFALTFFPPVPADPRHDFTFLGLLMDHVCDQHTPISHNQRTHKALILEKFCQYFERQIWPESFWSLATNETGVKFAAGTTGEGKKIPSEIKDLGTASWDIYLNFLAHADILVGIGDPVLRSSPLEGLCLGVHFLSPVFEGEGKNRDWWNSQHLFLQRFDPPYVYNVRQGDYKGLWVWSISAWQLGPSLMDGFFWYLCYVKKKVVMQYRTQEQTRLGDGYQNC